MKAQKQLPIVNEVLAANTYVYGPFRMGHAGRLTIQASGATVKVGATCEDDNDPGTSTIPVYVDVTQSFVNLGTLVQSSALSDGSISEVSAVEWKTVQIVVIVATPGPVKVTAMFTEETGALARGGAGTVTESAIRAAMATNSGDLPLNGHKVTGLANGVASTDAATVGQLASAGSPSELIFSTQQAAGGRVYTNLALFQAAITAQLPSTLVFDGTYAAPCVLSANLNCRGAKITGNGSNCFLTIADGKVLSNYGFQSSLVVTSHSNAACLSPLGGGGSYFLTLTDYASVVAPYAPALACMSSNTYTIILDHNASLGDGTNPVISAAGAAGVTIMASAGSHVEAQATTTAIGAVTTIKSLDPSVVVDAQTVTGSPPGTCTITRVVPAGADIAANGTIAKMQGTVVDMTGAADGQTLGIVDVLGTPTIKAVASGGEWPTIDANHTHYYKFQEISGSTFVDEINSNVDPLTMSTPGDWRLQASGLFTHGTKHARLTPSSANSVANRILAVPVAPATPTTHEWTLELFCRMGMYGRPDVPATTWQGDYQSPMQWITNDLGVGAGLVAILMGSNRWTFHSASGHENDDCYSATITGGNGLPGIGDLVYICVVGHGCTSPSPYHMDFYLNCRWLASMVLHDTSGVIGPTTIAVGSAWAATVLDVGYFATSNIARSMNYMEGVYNSLRQL